MRAAPAPFSLAANSMDPRFAGSRSPETIGCGMVREGTAWSSWPSNTRSGPVPVAASWRSPRLAAAPASTGVSVSGSRVVAEVVGPQRPVTARIHLDPELLVV